MDAIDPAAPSLSRGAALRAPSGQTTAQVEVEKLFRLHEGQIGRFLVQMLGDRALAADLTQETFVAALGEREDLHSITNPEAWLFRVARNLALQALRRRRRALNALRRLSLERHRDGDDPADAVAVRDHLARTLKPEARSILILRYVHGFTSEELAVIVDKSPEAVRKELSRTKRKLLQSLNQEPPDQSRKGVT